MTEHKEGSEVSKKISNLAECKMLYENINFMDALGAVLRQRPELLKLYTAEIMGELQSQVD